MATVSIPALRHLLCVRSAGERSCGDMAKVLAQTRPTADRAPSANAFATATFPALSGRQTPRLLVHSHADDEGPAPTTGLFHERTKQTRRERQQE